MEIVEYNPGISYLRVKIKSLAEEARIIRKEERKALDHSDRATYEGLRKHRTQDVRGEARAAQLAYAFVRGRPYAKIETRPDPLPWNFRFVLLRVAVIANKYSKLTVTKNDIERWMGLPVTAD